ncbi:hypothetical protein I541_5557 [Mycobacteroides abscessus]|nr:hypothetical protein I541_5557 [Mycobacteroides abscessus]
MILGFIGEMFRRQPVEGVGNLDETCKSARSPAGAGVTGEVLREISSLQVNEVDRQRTAGNEQQLTGPRPGRLCPASSTISGR